MAIYIDADKLKQNLADLYDFAKWDPREIHFSLFDMVGNIDGEPTADVAPVVHAHWIEDCGDYKCSHCSTEYWDEIVFIVRTSEHEFPNYCPVCGAKMDEEMSK